MTIDEAVENGIATLRRDPWAAGNYIKLHLIDGGGFGPWVEIHDPLLDDGLRDDTQKVLFCQLPQDGAWEEYLGCYRDDKGQLVNKDKRDA